MDVSIQNRKFLNLTPVGAGQEIKAISLTSSQPSLQSHAGIDSLCWDRIRKSTGLPLPQAVAEGKKILHSTQQIPGLCDPTQAKHLLILVYKG